MVPETQLARTVARWTTSLERLPSILSRLLVFGSLRDSNTGRYVHQGLALSIGEDATHDLLAQSHEQVFNEWQTMRLPEQMRDLKLHLREVASETEGPGPKKRSTIGQILMIWTQTEPYWNFVPLSMSALSREAFLINMRSMVAILRGRINHDSGTADSL